MFILIEVLQNQNIVLHLPINKSQNIYSLTKSNIMNTETRLTETQAILKAKNLLNAVSGENWTISYMEEKECDNFIWSYLFENGLQYLSPIKYGTNNLVALCHQQ